MSAAVGWAGRRVLVTGATGLLGSWLVARLLALGADVVVFVLDADPRSELIRTKAIERCAVVNGRLEDAADVARAVVWHEVDVVFHLGAQTLVTTALESPLTTFEANVRGTWQLLEACRSRRRPPRVVVASSDKAYGDAPALPYTEETPLLARHPYDVSKSCADLVARCYAATYGLPVGIARCGNIYGGGDLNWGRIVPGTIRSALRGEQPVLRSDGTPTRDYVYVEDVVEAYLGLAVALEDEELAGEAFNFAPERPLSVLEITATLLRLLGREDLSPIVLGSARSEIHDQYLSCAKARRVLGWSPSFALEDGLARTISWYRAYLAA